MYLAYLGFLFFQPLFDPGRDIVDWLVVIILSGLFLPIYFAAFLTKKHALTFTALMVLLGVVGMYLNSGSSIFFVYAAAVAARSSSGRKAVKLVAAIALTALLSSVFSPIPLPYRIWAYGPAVIFSILIGLIGIFQYEKERANAKLRLAHEEIEQLATVAERERIARDLHDLLGHTLSLISLKSELANKYIDIDTNKAKKEIEDIEDISRKTLKEVRAAISGYRSRGLQVEISDAKLMLGSANIDFSYQVDLECLSPVQEAGLGLMLREAVTNIVRHSRADTAKLTIYCRDSNVVFKIQDNGIGFTNVEGNGLRGIRERAEALGGSFEINSAKGTALLITLPTAKEPAKKDGVER